MNHPFRRWSFACLVALFFVAGASQATESVPKSAPKSPSESSLAPATAKSDLQRYARWVKRLASDEFEGRGVGTEGLAKARDMIKAHFDGLPLRPAFDASMTQALSVRSGVAAKRQALAVAPSGNHKPFDAVAKKDFVPFGFSSNGDFRGEAVFVGYAIDADQHDYDSIGSAEDDAVRGKVAIALRYEPQDDKGQSLWSKEAGSWSREAALTDKARWGRDRGAVALLVVNPPSSKEKGLVSTRRTAFGTQKIPAMQISPAFLERLLDNAGIGLDEVIQKANDSGGVDPLPLTLSGNVELEKQQTEVENVAVVLPGAGALADQYVVVGAHYDHIGFGHKDKKEVYPGADDNASGTAGVMLLAEWFGNRKNELPTPRRSIVFVTFAGEEIGLLGSKHMVEHTEKLGIEAKQITTMFNMDMIGRVKDNQLGVWGVDSGKGLRKLVDGLASETDLKLRLSGPGAGASDHAAFYRAKIPVLCLNTGIHRDMHKRSDTFDKINIDGAIDVLRFAEKVILRLATEPERIAYAPPTKSKHGYLGVMPEMSDAGCRIGRVLEKGPAAAAGVREGDILLECGKKPIKNPGDLIGAVRSKKPGQTIQLKILRDDKEIEISVRLGRR